MYNCRRWNFDPGREAELPSVGKSNCRQTLPQPSHHISIQPHSQLVLYRTIKRMRTVFLQKSSVNSGMSVKSISESGFSAV